MTTEKICSFCKGRKDISCFKTTKNDRGYIVIRSRCQSCLNDIGKYYNSLKKDIQEYKEKNKTNSKEWRVKNPERLKIRANDYYLKNKERLSSYYKEYSKKQVDEITEIYLAHNIFHRDFPPELRKVMAKELIDLKKPHLLLKRKINQIRHGKK